MRVSSCLLSLLLHVGILFLGLYFPWQGTDKPVDLGRPAYEVNLVRAPEPEPEPEQAEQIPAQEDQAQTAEKEPSSQEPAQPQASKKQSQPQKKTAQPKPVRLQKDSQAEGKPAPERRQKKEKQPPKQERQPPKQEKQAEQRKKAQAQPSRDELLNQALGDIRQHAQSQEESEQDYLAQELASLRSQADEGSARSSRGSGSSRLEEIYGLQVQSRIQENWRYPSLGRQKDLAAEVEIQIDAQGEIVSFSLRNGSGRRDFDSSVLRAVQDTERLPRPPREDLREISITFHAQDLEG
ncbi:MAG: TonB family protein [Desulfohalobiaceae bacterium]